jgi:hypothetical protein
VYSYGYVKYFYHIIWRGYSVFLMRSCMKNNCVLFSIGYKALGERVRVSAGEGYTHSMSILMQLLGIAIENPMVLRSLNQQS